MKVIFYSTTYNVNKEKGVVTCIITAGLDPTSRQEMICARADLYRRLRFQAIGISKLHQDDKWDEVIGKRVAESKAKIQVYKIGRRKCLEFLKYVDIFGQDASDQMEKLKDFEKVELIHLDVLKKSEPELEETNE